MDGRGKIECDHYQDNLSGKTFAHCQIKDMRLEVEDKPVHEIMLSLDPHAAGPCCAGSVPCYGGRDCPCELLDAVREFGGIQTEMEIDMGASIFWQDRFFRGE